MGIKVCLFIKNTKKLALLFPCIEKILYFCIVVTKRKIENEKDDTHGLDAGLRHGYDDGSEACRD